ncbi:MAG: hypothetical protein K8R40_11315 [Anaerolineaceae bacterium]|nr:hypothetical protein [Anaerolineaceae bacterium]
MALITPNHPRERFCLAEGHSGYWSTTLLDEYPALAYRIRFSSTTIITDESGTIVSEMKYTAFGEIRDINGTSPTDYESKQRFDFKVNALGIHSCTGQRKEIEFGLSYYVSQWNESYLLGSIFLGQINMNSIKKLIILMLAVILYSVLLFAQSCGTEQPVAIVTNTDSIAEEQPTTLLHTQVHTEPVEITASKTPAVSVLQLPLQEIEDAAQDESLPLYARRMLEFLDSIDKKGGYIYSESLSSDMKKVTYGKDSDRIIYIYNSELEKSFQVDPQQETMLDDYWVNGFPWSPGSTSFAIHIGTSHQVDGGRAPLPATERLIIYTFDQSEEKYLAHSFIPPNIEDRVDVWAPEGSEVPPHLQTFEWSSDGSMTALVYSDYREVFIVDRYGNLIETIEGMPDFITEKGYSQFFNAVGWSKDSQDLYLYCSSVYTPGEEHFIYLVKVNIATQTFELLETPPNEYTYYYVGFDNPWLILYIYQVGIDAYVAELYDSENQISIFQVSTECWNILPSSDRNFILIDQGDEYWLYSVETNDFISTSRGDEWAWGWYDGLDGFLVRGEREYGENEKYFRVISPTSLFEEYD